MTTPSHLRKPFLMWTDIKGRPWHVYDFVQLPNRKKRRPIGSADAIGRAFVPDDWKGPILVYYFAGFPSREPEDGYLNRQVQYARPLVEPRADAPTEPLTREARDVAV